MKQLKVYSVRANFKVDVEADDGKEAEEIGKRLMAKHPDELNWQVTLSLNTEYVEKGGGL